MTTKETIITDFDGFELAGTHPYYEHHLKLNQIGAEIVKKDMFIYYFARLQEPFILQFKKQEQSYQHDFYRAIYERIAHINKIYDPQVNTDQNRFLWRIKSTLEDMLEYFYEEGYVTNHEVITEFIPLATNDLDQLLPLVKQLYKAYPNVSLSEALTNELRASRALLQANQQLNYHISTLEKRDLSVRMISELLQELELEPQLAAVVPWFEVGKETERVISEHDQYPLYPIDGLYEEQVFLDKLYTEAFEVSRWGYDFKTKQAKLGKKILESSRDQQLRYFKAFFARSAWAEISVEPRMGKCFRVFDAPMNDLAKRSLPYTEEDLILLVTQLPKHINRYRFSYTQFLRNVERHVKKNGMSAEMRQALEDFLAAVDYLKEEDKEYLKVQDIFALVDQAKEAFPIRELNADDWGKQANTLMKKDKKQGSLWSDLLQHCSAKSGSKPSAKFLKDGKAKVKAIGAKKVVPQLIEWLQYLSKIPTTQKALVSGPNQAIIKGIIWLVGAYEAPELNRTLAALAQRSYHKIPGRGPTAAALGNACIYALAQQGMNGVAELTRLKLRVRQTNTKRLIDRYVQEVAKQNDVTKYELEDMAVPDFGLKDGIIEQQFGDFKAILEIQSTSKTVLRWFKPDGKEQKSVPAAVRKEHASALKTLRQQAKDIQKMLPAQRDRMDRFYIQKRHWTLQKFKPYFLDHGLLSFITKKTIWTFQGAVDSEGIWLDGSFVDVNGKPLDWIDANTRVTLWHPIGSSIDYIVAWRDFLEKHEIQQPLKQAYREVYLLTEAEENTDTYSNRMAAHILKQHQFNTLAKIRDWQYSLMGAYDDGVSNMEATLSLSEWEMRAEFWVNEVNMDGTWTDSGIWSYVATDQVRFIKSGRQISLAKVPPLVFSEVMRDVDLFVGVASVGNDPNWQDSGGITNQHRDYWQSYSFGDLQESAKIRKSVLERLIPRLKIADKCKIEGKFVIVEGKLRTYKIHIGSTNILMEPNDQYLCIVPDRKSLTTDKVFLPFEGDKALSVVLSKAFLLVADDKITDSSIVSQIKQ